MLIERWAFSATELNKPGDCNSHDELVAVIDIDDDGDGIDSFGIIVYRNGKVSNRFADGSTGVPKEFAALANAEEILHHPDGEETFSWRDVGVTTTGDFVRFV